MSKERWHDRVVRDDGLHSAHGSIRFEGRVYEHTSFTAFIRPGDKVQVRRLTGVNRIAVRKVHSDGTFGGEETWTCV